MTDLMIDIETLGTTPGCAIVSIGAVYFDRHGDEMGPEFYQAVRLSSCTDLGLTMCPSTVDWWMQRADKWPEQSRASLLSVALMNLARFMEHDPTACLWAHGATFDPPILAAAYRACSLRVPWGFRQVRDTRTLFDLAGVDFRTEAHHALEDAREQARAVQEAIRRLRGGATQAELS